jgi:Protein of unknown function (DUF3261)
LQAVLAAMLAATIGCRGQSAEPMSVRWRLALPPSSFPELLSLQQQVKVEQAGRTVDFDAVLDITPDMVTLVGMAFSQRVFTLQYDGVKLQESRSAMLPDEVQAGDVLSDLQLALWPSDAVRPALPGGWTLADSASQRILSEADTVRAVISYSSTPRWSGTISLDNRQYGYRLTIRSAVQR